MAVIKPTLSLTANSNTVTTDPGPMSFALALSVTDSITTDVVEQKLITVTTTRASILDGSVVGGATKTPGTIGCYIYMKNTDTTTGNNIHVGIVSPNHHSADPATPATDGATSSLDGTTQESLRTFTLLPGEFAFFPYDYCGDIYVESAQNSPILEYWRYDR